MAIMRWEPFPELVSLRDAMDRLFEDSLARLRPFSGDSQRWTLPIDMYQTDNDLVVKVALPGLKPEDVDISITGDTLTIRGEHKEEREARDEDYFYRERRYGAFSRSVPIPLSVSSDKAEAVFENGVLTLTLPKAEELKPKQIKVKASKMLEAAKK